jgi:ribosomal protein L37AE/L43A
METERTPQPVCPACGATAVERRGTVVAMAPYERPDPPGVHRPQKVVERKYQCLECRQTFSTVEEIVEGV